MATKGACAPTGSQYTHHGDPNQQALTADPISRTDGSIDFHGDHMAIVDAGSIKTLGL